MIPRSRVKLVSEHDSWDGPTAGVAKVNGKQLYFQYLGMILPSIAKKLWEHRKLILIKLQKFKRQMNFLVLMF